MRCQSVRVVPVQGEVGDSEPDWVASERKVFQTERDSDGDGFMTFEEIKQWIIPEVRAERGLLL